MNRNSLPGISFVPRRILGINMFFRAFSVVFVLITTLGINFGKLIDLDDFRSPREESLPLEGFRERRQDRSRVYYTDRDIFGTKPSPYQQQLPRQPQQQPSRQQYQPYLQLSNRGPDNQCKCDLEYVLKYKSDGVQAGNYHVKVFHEETGHFHPNRGADSKGWASEKPFSRGNQVIQGRRGEYYEDEEPIRETSYAPGDKKSVPSRVRNDLPVYESRSTRSLKKSLKIARAILSHAKWATVGIVSQVDSVFGGFTLIERVRLAILENGRSQGIPVFVLPPLILNSMEDTQNDVKITLTLSPAKIEEDQNPPVRCDTDSDHLDWKCAKVVVLGTINLITSTELIEIAAESILSRHPNAKLNHDAVFATVDIQKIMLTKSGSNFALIPVEDFI